MMEKILQQILTELKNLSEDINGIKPKVDELYGLKSKIEESHEWLSALHHNSQVHKAEMDQVQHKIAVIEGALIGAANSLLEPLKKAQ